MVQDLEDIMVAVLGVGSDQLNIWQMLLRALVIYLLALTLARVGETRLLGKNTAFDVILGVILGSVMSRAINGSAPLLETIGAGAALVALHWLFAALAVHSNIFSRLLKGRATLLVREGDVQPQALREHHLGKHDLEEALRKQGYTPDLKQVQAVYFERDGTLSVIPRQREPRVVDVRVEDGVQVVRLEIS